MNPEEILAHLKRLTASLSWTQIGTLAGVFVTVVGVLVGTAYWINTPTYTVLFSDMDSESASSVVTKLKTDKVDYQLDEGGRTIRVPNTRVDELRLSFSSQGMPASGRIGFEIFDRTAFGTTEFLEHVNYRRALEGELARTITTISEVSGARVHIAMAKDSLFATDKQSAKASVVLKLKGRKPLAPQTITAIAGLVAASVEDLRPEGVVVLDTFGRSLTGKDNPDDQDAGGLTLDKQHRLERDLTTKVVSLLEPIVGEGHVRVNVAARLNASSAEETEEHWDPATVLRSRQTSSDIGATPAGALLTGGAGIGGTIGAGARANTPPGSMGGGAATPLPPPPGTPPSRTVESTNFEVGRVTRHTISPSGQVARLSVAVLIDDSRPSAAAAPAAAPPAAGANGAAAAAAPSTPPPASKPRSPEDLERIHKLVAAAVGFEEDRGDQLTVENISFDEGEQMAPEAPKTLMQRVSTAVQSDGAFEAGRTLGIVVLAVLAFLLFLRPVMNKALAPPPTGLPSHGLPNLVGGPAAAAALGAAGGLQTIAALEEQVEAGLLRPEDHRITSLTRNVAKMADDEPEAVARLVRTWISENE